MKTYPSITTRIDNKNVYCIFDKLDGSNIRAEWSNKKGFYKFGSRTQLLTESQGILFSSIEKIKKFRNSEGIVLNEYLKQFNIESAVCFFEYYSDTSFAGSHPQDEDEMKLALIDVSFYKKGMLCPENFIKYFNSFPIPKILYKGKITEELLDSVRNSTLEGMTEEGIIAKELNSVDGRFNMFKFKSRLWLDKLADFCKNDSALFNRLK